MHTLIHEANRLLIVIDCALQKQLRHEESYDLSRIMQLHLIRKRSYERLVRRLNKYFPIE